MCGICGLIREAYATNENKETINKMLNAIKHRGPDGSGIWTDNYIALGHNRLAIIDLTDAGRQPMHRGDWVIIFNGEIYNYIEIKKELKEQYSVEFHTESDTEVILAAWETWAEKSLEKFRGMWAFAIYNKRTYEFYLCRDRFGIKPLYYYDQRNSFIFASEIKAILEVASVSRTAYLPAIIDFLVGFHDHNENTFFKDIRQLPPSHYLHLNLKTNCKKLIRYYNLDSAIECRISTVEDFSKAFQESILLHLRSDVPIGTCLSGGLDSSSVATTAAIYMKEIYNKSFYAVTAQSEDNSNDETRYAKQVVDCSGLIWHVVKPKVNDFLQDWERCLWHQDEPTGGPSIFMQYMVMKTAREAGITVMLDGQGGDEILLGYERYFPSFFLTLVKKGMIKQACKEFVAATQHSKLSAKQLTLYSMYFLMPNIRVSKKRMALKKVPKELLEYGLKTVAESSRSYYDLKSLQIAEVNQYQLPHLLKYEDRNSMAWSVEARVPFIDHKLIEVALTLIPEEKITEGYTKWALRKVMEGKMPDSITWRRNKIGFEAPDARWLASLKGEIESKISRSTVIKELNLQNSGLMKEPFTLYNLACWEDLFAVNLA